MFQVDLRLHLAALDNENPNKIKSHKTSTKRPYQVRGIASDIAEGERRKVHSRKSHKRQGRTAQTVASFRI